jgi:transposase
MIAPSSHPSDEIEQLRREIDDVKRERDDVKRERDDVKRERDDVKRERDDVKRERDDVKRECDDVKRECDDVKRERDDVKRERDHLKLERDHFKAELDAKIRAIYAAKSEARRDPAQQDLFFNEAEMLAPAAEKSETVSVAAHQKKKTGRKPLDPALPRETVRIEISESERQCAHDGSLLKEIGVEVSERLDIIPAQIKVIRTERVKYACPCCERSIKTAPALPHLISNGLFTANAIAWIVINKYQDGLPLYRQAVILNRLGGDIARNTIASMVVRVGEAVQPIINLLQEHWRDAHVKHIDETVVQVLKEPGRAAQTKSYFWVRASDDGPSVRLFDYSPTRSGKTALELLAGTQGVLMSDGYEAYEKPAELTGLVHLGCWVHARRYFVEAEATIPKQQRNAEHPATRMLALIGELYVVEKHAREQKLDAQQRGKLRQEKSAEVIEKIKSMRDELIHNTLPKSSLGNALHYLNSQWPKLIRFLENGAWPLDNNPAENAIRPFVVGRKNWLFSDTIAGAKASANLYTLIETAKANGMEPYRYLAHLFAELPKAGTVAQIEALLPWNVQSV